MPPHAPLLIALPHGLNVSGVALWGVRLAGAIAQRGGSVALLLHREPQGHARLDIDLHPDVRLFDTNLPAFDAPEASFHAALTTYRDAVTSMLQQSESPLVLSPNLHAECYRVCATLAKELSPNLRIVGWAHSDNAYDSLVLGQFAPLLSGAVGVSQRIASQVESACAASDVRCRHIPYGVPVPPRPPTREPLTSDRPIRLIYTGRLEHHQKRIMALPALSRRLADLNVPHELTIVGDGPARADLVSELDGLASVRLAEPVGPTSLQAMLCDADAFVLPSRFEGLSVSMLEALAAGCVPFVTRVASGAAEAISHAHNGCLVDAPDEATDTDVGIAMANEIARIRAKGPDAGAALSHAAWKTAHDRYSLSKHAEHATRLLNTCALSPPPHISDDLLSDRPVTVPLHAESRVRELLSSLEGRPILIHGCGEHTRIIWNAIRATHARIVGLADDDPARAGQQFEDLPILPPGNVTGVGATDVVISSYLHEAAIWQRRGVYEAQGLRVHRLYAA